MVINLGKNSGIEKNKYWSVLNIEINEEYYIMNCENKLVKIDYDSIDKIKNYKYTWYIIPCGYCVSTFNKSKIYMHAYLMDHYGHGKGQLSVDHINKNIYDNRLSNLCITTKSIQNENKSYKKKSDSKYNTNRPDGIENITLPRRMEYKLENEKYTTKDNTIKYRIKEYFSYSYRNPISKEIKIIKSSRSTKKSALEKYNELMHFLKENNIHVTYG
jgi:hypothetical protein